MKTTHFILALCAGLAASPAAADCLVEYKAKRGTEYVHTTMTVPDNLCNPGAATPYVVQALEAQGMEFLAVVKVTPSG